MYVHMCMIYASLLNLFPPFHQTLFAQPIHFHHSHDVAGSVIRRNLIQESEQRCIAIHGTNSVMIDNNVAYDTRGHCFILEEGSETDNTFKDNLGARTKKGKLKSKRQCMIFMQL